MGLAAPPQSLQPHRRARDLGRARRTDRCRPVSDAAGPHFPEGARGRGRVGHRLAGRTGTRQPGARRSAGQGLGSQQRGGHDTRARRAIAPDARQPALAVGPRAALRGEASDAPRRAPAALADRAQPAGVRHDAAGDCRRIAVAAAACGMRADSPVRFLLHRALGKARPEIRPGRAPRRTLPQLALRRAAARALLGRRAEAAGRASWLRRVPPSPRTARPRDDAGGLPRRPGRRLRA